MKILVTGPESSGKTTLCQRIVADILPDAAIRSEVARTYLENLDRPYCASDLSLIWQEQVLLEQKLERQYQWVVCDTAHFVMGVWNEVVFQADGLHCEDLLKVYPADYDLVLLCSPDLEWEADPLREAPDINKRQYLFDRYRSLLEEHGLGYAIVSGKGEKRYDKLEQLIKNLS